MRRGDANALYPFKSRGFGGEIGLDIRASSLAPVTQQPVNDSGDR